jgi:hypothetical protein
MSGATVTIRVPLAVRKRGGRKTVVLPNGAVQRAAPPVVAMRADPAVVKALARAFRWQKLLDERRCASISELARAEKIERGFLGKMLQLTLLAPDIVEGVLDGRTPGGIGLIKLKLVCSADWAGQHTCVSERLVHGRTPPAPQSWQRKLP